MVFNLSIFREFAKIYFSQMGDRVFEFHWRQVKVSRAILENFILKRNNGK